MKTIIVTSVVLCLMSAVAASAQSITQYQANYYNAGAPSPVQSETFLVAVPTCNQVAPAVNTVNPTRLIWDDIANVGKVCIFTGSPTGPLFSLPIGSYEATLIAVNGAGPSPESVRAPFSRLASPATPTNVKAVR